MAPSSLRRPAGKRAAASWPIVLRALAALAAASGLPALAVAQPNIIIVNIDDMGWGDFGAYGSGYSETPNIDQLASEGTKFTQFYAGAPICSPSRASLFTGQYSARSGINSFLNDSNSNLDRDNADSLQLTAPSMARTFHDNGYATGHFGKWHLGGGRDVGYAVNPTPGTNVAAPRIVEYGYDQAWTQFEGLGNRIINVVDYGGDAAGVTTRPSAYFNGLNQQSDARGTGGGLDQLVYLERQYNATFMVDRAIEFIDQTKAADPNKPFLMNVWLDEVHTPHDPPDSFQAKYNNDPRYAHLSQETRDYLAVLEYADQQIGRLVNHVDQLGLGEETLILVMSDNGATTGNGSSIGSNGPFRGGKGDLFEGGVREPLIARWTGNVAAGRTDGDTVMWMPDLFPTLAGLAGVSSPPGVALDGENLGDALLGNQSQSRSTPLFWNMNRGTETRHANPNSTGAGAGGQEVIAIRSGNWKLLLNAQGTAPELYDVSTDLGETNNLAFQQSAIANQLASEALAIRYSTPSRSLPDAVNPLVRLKAEDLAGLGNGAAVSSWSDSATGDSFSGSVSQASSANQPKVVTGALGGRAVVEFDGDDALFSSTSNALPTPAKGVTVIAVATSDTTGDAAQRLGQFGSSTGAAGNVVGFDASSSTTAESNGGAGFRFNNGASLHDTPLADPGFHIVVWQVGDGQAYADARMFVDGTMPANAFVGGGGSPSSATTFSGSDLELILGTGRGANGGVLNADYFSGQLAEMLVFNDQLSIGQINLVGNYLSSEYGLPFAYETTLNLFDVQGLSWTGGTANFGLAWNAGNGAGGPAGTNTDPFVGGVQDLYLANGGTAFYNDATNTSAGSRLNSLRIGTAHAGLLIAGSEGNGTLTATGSKSLTIGNGSTPVAGAETGDLTVGEAGYAGTLNWGSTGTLKVEGRLRVGQGGTGVFNQDGGIVTAGDTGGSLKFMAVGNGAGSSGVYNLNNGRLLPGGGISGSQLRHLRIGNSGAQGVMTIGDGIGAVGSASVETIDDVNVGYDGGHGELVIAADGALTLQGGGAEFRVGQGAGSTGLATQRGGTLSVEALFTIGQGTGAVGEYRLEGGSIAASGVIRVGGGGGNGTLRVQGGASLVSSGNLFVAQNDTATATKGLLEITGSQANFQIARLSNHFANDETIRWVADAGGVSPIVIVGSGGAERVQLQSPSEVSANSGANGSGNLSGDGIALSLDLSALSASQTITLIDNRSDESVTGFFENAATGFLYEEGEQVAGTGFSGTVTISYLGSSGIGSANNDVVLNLVASPGNNADFDDDGDVDGADFLAWQRGLGIVVGAVLGDGDANGDGDVDALDLTAWRNQFGSALVAANATVPEPSAKFLILAMLLAVRYFQ